MKMLSLGGKKFDKLDVQRIYFGNWLRDFSQTMDVGTLSKVGKQQILNLLMVFGNFIFNIYKSSFKYRSVIPGLRY